MPRRARVAALLACLACLVGAGCYERVVNARGFGADRVNIHDGDRPGPNPAGSPTGTPLSRQGKMPGSD